MQNIITKTSDTSVSKILKFPIGQRPNYWIRLKPMSFRTWCIVASTEVSSITQTEFNDGNTTFFINIANIGKKNDKYFELYRANLNFKIKKDGSLQLLKNGKLVTNSNDISLFLDLFQNMATSYPEVFDKLVGKKYGVLDYHLSRNQKLLQLPCSRKFLESFYYSLDNNHRNRVNYHLRKGNTYKATSALLGYDFPKSIRKLLLSDTKYAYGYSQSRRALIAGVPVDTVRMLIQQKRFNLLDLLGRKPTLTGWRINEQKEIPEHDPQDFFVPSFEYPSESIARDILRMIRGQDNFDNQLLVEIDITDMSNNIRQLHDEVLPVYIRSTDLVRATDYAEKNKYHNSDYDVAKVANYIIRPVVNSNECSRVGRAMSICVGGYSTDHNKGLLEILVVTDDNDNYLACLEFKNYTLVQAKLKYNNRVSNDKHIHQAIMMYCDQFGLKVSTSDMYVA